ncbi:MAG: hypothetical protein KAI66_03265, partial [Lentisphaeria bacterium]|nr:hypothetical protein [Lentisphaeria bacterium]
MSRALRILFALSCSGTLWAQPVNLARQALQSADTRSTTKDPKYGIHRAFDGNADTHWASAATPSLPHIVRVKWNESVTFDTICIDVFAKELPRLYATWSSFELRLDNGVTHRIDEPTSNMRIVRFEKPQTCTGFELSILTVAAPKTYLGLDELAVYLDPNRSIQPPRTLAFKSRSLKAMPKGRAQHPCVSSTPDELARARKRADSTEWGRREKKATLAQAAPWMEHDDAHWRAFLPEPGACYAYGFTGCPACGASFGTWGGARCSWEKPGQVTCGKGHAFPNAQHPDDGAGYQAKDGRMHYFLGIWNSWVTEQWTTRAIPALANAYALTGDEIYAARAGLFLDLLASIYPESTSGSWDYPSSPPSGRFARPWYQVARTLVVFIDAYDLIYSSDTLDRPSLRPGIQRTFSPSPRLQKRAVGTVDASGVSHAGMTRRENIDRNLVMDGGGYCFDHSFSGGLHNGHADYMRGALAAGALLGIEHWVTNAVDSPYSIYSMLANNADRDGRYYETSLGYALHARNLYLTYVLPLRNWRSERHPNGIDLFDDARMRSFYYLPASVMLCAGHTPNYGDAGPDSSCRIPGKRPFTRTDYQYAEWLAAFAHGEARERGLRILGFLTKGNVPRARLNSSASFRRWMLFHAAEVPDNMSQTLPDDLAARVNGCWAMGQKGIAILRDGKEADAQAALLRFGPSLNHGDRDDLGLLYYGRGWQLTYEIGYGLGSTHCQV